MSTANESEVMVGTRLSKTLHAKLLKHQRDLKRLTGIEPSVSAIVRAMIEESLDNKRQRRARAA